MNDIKSLRQYEKGKFANQHLKYVRILDAIRLQKRSDMDPNLFTVTNLVKVTYVGRIVPDYIVLDGLRVRVRPFHKKTNVLQ